MTGRYDRLISVEMIEAVEHQYLDTYLNKLDSLLTDDGQAILQAITIRDQRFEDAKRDMDFIKRYIFPGGFLPSHHAMLTSVMRKTSLNVVALDEVGQHYARTNGATGLRQALNRSANLVMTSALYACGATICVTAKAALSSVLSVPATCC